jgi:hypothetical protein
MKHSTHIETPVFNPLREFKQHPRSLIKYIKDGHRGNYCVFGPALILLGTLTRIPIQRKGVCFEYLPQGFYNPREIENIKTLLAIGEEYLSKTSHRRVA